MSETSNWLAFAGTQCVAAGQREDVARMVAGTDAPQTVLIFDEETGRQVDIDLRGTPDEVAARVAPGIPAPESRGRGRPKLGVVPREVTLLPRHWDWLGQQRGGASATLRRLVDQARAGSSGPDRKRHAQAATDRIMGVLAGDLPHYEEASRALYAGEEEGFAACTAGWPADVRKHVMRLAAPVFES